MNDSSYTTSDGRVWVNGVEIPPEQNRRWIIESNLKLYRRQLDERNQLNHRYGDGWSIIVHMPSSTNPHGEYTATVANPINCCAVGFGATPYRALKDLAAKMEAAADKILHAVEQQPSEIPALEAELAAMNSTVKDA